MYNNSRRTKKSPRLSYNTLPSASSEPLPDDWYESITKNNNDNIIPEYPSITEPPQPSPITPDVTPGVVSPQVNPSNFPAITGKTAEVLPKEKQQMSNLNTLILVLVVIGGGYMAMKYMKKNNSRFGMSTSYNIRSAYNMAK